MQQTMHDFQMDIDAIARIPAVSQLLDVISSTTGMGFIAIARVTEDRWVTCSSRDDLAFGLKPGDELQVKTTICNEIRQSGKAVLIDHVAENPIFHSHHTPAMYGFQSYISVPIYRKDGQFFGTLCAIDPNPKDVSSPAIKGMFELFADLISFHLEAVEQRQIMEMTIAQRTQELKENYDELEKMNKELQSFAYISSHDLQEPLRKIQMMSSMIEDKELDVLSESGKGYFRRIKIAAARMQSLISDLLAFSRAVNSDKKFELLPLAPLVEDVLLDFADEFKAKNGTIKIDLPLPLKVIPFQFRQLIYNLISNSVKFAHSDRPLEISIESRKSNETDLGLDREFAVITFSDNGIGFDQKYSARIFEMFQSLHDRTKYEGTGLGLAIVKKIVENHQGTITVASMIDNGVTFAIYLPL